MSKNVSKLRRFLELKKQSRDKWKEIEYNIKNKVEIDYIWEYHIECGFCRISDILSKHSDDCSNCKLHNTTIDGKRVCNFAGECNHVSKALIHADNNRWAKALEHCRLVLETIRIDIQNDAKKLRRWRGNDEEIKGKAKTKSNNRRGKSI